ncbi:MAG: hypothetical protein E3J21_19010 [Anaerolineales bacterium]|nr:MAG: hypothetical protein E3J21_19010 [Anaerolineales bacterium]
MEHTPSAEPEEEIAAAQIGELDEDATSEGDHVEEDMPGGQFVEKPAPVSAGFWVSFVEEG